MVDGRFGLDVVQFFEHGCKACAQVDSEAIDREALDIVTREIGKCRRKPLVDRTQVSGEAFDSKAGDRRRSESVGRTETAHSQAQDNNAARGKHGRRGGTTGGTTGGKS